MTFGSDTSDVNGVVVSVTECLRASIKGGVSGPEGFWASGCPGLGLTAKVGVKTFSLTRSRKDDCKRLPACSTLIRSAGEVIRSENAIVFYVHLVVLAGEIHLG